jgi:flagellar hook-basal body complex protein FliE
MSLPAIAASVLSSPTAAASQLQSIFGPVSAGLNGTADGNGFTDLMKTALNQVATMQDSAQAQVSNVLAGKGNADLGKVMVSVEKADVSFQLMMQVRNKIVSAYQDIEKAQF